MPFTDRGHQIHPFRNTVFPMAIYDLESAHCQKQAILLQATRSSYKYKGYANLQRCNDEKPIGQSSPHLQESNTP